MIYALPSSRHPVKNRNFKGGEVVGKLFYITKVNKSVISYVFLASALLEVAIIGKFILQIDFLSYLYPLPVGLILNDVLASYS